MLQRNLLAGFFCALMLVAPAFADITVSSPANGSTVPSSVHVVATASSNTGYPITAMRIYVDNISVFLTYSSSIDTFITLAAGGHFVVVQSWDSSGFVTKAPLNITVAAQTNAKVFGSIDQMTGWESCDVCSGAGGNGPSASHWQAQFQTSPSLDGASSEFFLGGATPYSSALWWKQLGAIDTARFFKYDIDFFLTDANAPQALEFDVNQSVGGQKYIFGTECDIRGSKQWRVWDYYALWQATGVPCTPFAANAWHHLTWELERTLDAHTHFIAVTVDGIRYVVDRYYRPGPSGVRELNVAFQMDGNSSITPYNVWLDKVTLTAW